MTRGQRDITWDDVELLVVGAGTMGASIAQAYAQNGFRVGLLDVSEEILQRALETIDRELGAARGRIFTEDDIRRIKGRILATTSYEEACRGKGLELVVEAATERLDVKKKIFQELDRLCDPKVVLATNSSSLDTNILARVTKRPDKVVWMHYFYLPHKNRGSEYAGSDTASPESMEVARRYFKLGGKVPILIRGSRRGGAADIIFVALLHEATRMLEEGHPIPEIEEAGRRAYGIPMGFLALMDNTGIPVGLHAMRSFSDAGDPEDPLYKVYGNFYVPRENYVRLIDRLNEAADKDTVRWVSPEEAAKPAGDEDLVVKLKERFMAVGFATSAEVVGAGLITSEDLERLCHNAFLWREGPFTIMNRVGVGEAWRMVKERAGLAEKDGVTFPAPDTLRRQAEKGEPWPLALSPILYDDEEGGVVARITISNPRAANAMDNEVFDGWEECFRRAYDDDRVKAVVVDSAPIKTFIAGANVPDFVKRVKGGDYEAIRRDTARWQEVLFHTMTGAGEPKVVIVDGATYGGGVEVALAFAADPDSIVIATERTTYALPETRLGIYPGLRGTFMLPQVIHRGTGDEELAVAMARYYILAGGTATSSPRLLKHLGLVDLLVPARDRDRAAARVAQALAEKGAVLSGEELASLGIEELPSELTFEEKEEIRVMKDLFLRADVVPALYSYGRGWSQPFFAGDAGPQAVRIARRVANNSPHAVSVADVLISQGFAWYRAGVSNDEIAQWELDKYLVPVFRHPDALEGLAAMTEGRFPSFNRAYPL